jgi:hypothetical protein
VSPAGNGIVELIDAVIGVLTHIVTAAAHAKNKFVPTIHTVQSAEKVGLKDMIQVGPHTRSPA